MKSQYVPIFLELGMVEPREHRIHMYLSKEELEAIDTWRFQNRVATRSEAIRRLCQSALIFDRRLPAILENSETSLASSKALLQDLLARDREVPESAIDSLRSLVSLRTIIKAAEYGMGLVKATATAGDFAAHERGIRNLETELDIILSDLKIDLQVRSYHKDES